MATPALLALVLGTLGAIAAPSLPDHPLLSVSAADPKSKNPFNVTCILHHAAAAAAADFTITANNRTWPVTRDGHRATAEVTVPGEGGVRLGCSVRAAGAELRAESTVQAYYLPVPLLNVTGAAVAGAELRGRCSVPAGAGSDIQVLVRARGRDLGKRRQPPVDFRLPLLDEDAERGLELVCVAEMAPFAPRNKSLRIRVRAAPRLDARSCPPQQNWTEGQLGVLLCRAWGAPEPQVSCSKGGHSIAAGAARRADRAHAGTYLCRAANELGTAESRVTLWVHYADSVPLLLVLLGVLLPALALLGLAGAFLLLRHRAKIGQYRLWKRQPPPAGRPAAAAPDGSAAP